MARLRSSLLGLFVIGALLGVGCGEDPAPAKGGSSNNDDDNDDDDDNTSKKDAGKDAGKATDAGKKDAGAAVATVECGSKTCKGGVATPPLPAAMPCCFSEEDEVCGVVSPLSGTCGGPVENDDRCPALSLGGTMAAGCCTSENHCGINAASFGVGCADLSSPMLRMFVPNAPPPMTCDGELLEPPAAVDAGTSTSDAGKSDAGTAATDAGKTDAGKTDAGK